MVVGKMSNYQAAALGQKSRDVLKVHRMFKDGTRVLVALSCGHSWEPKTLPQRRIKSFDLLSRLSFSRLKSDCKSIVK